MYQRHNQPWLWLDKATTTISDILLRHKMDTKKSLLKDLPFEYTVREFPHPTDIENLLGTPQVLWQYIFKDDNWLKLAKTHDRCVPVLIGCNLSAFRPRKSSNHLYLVLMASDHSGDLQYCQDEFFGSLQEGWVYNKDEHEISFPSGMTVNVQDIMAPSEETLLPMKKIFSRNKGGLELEYYFYQDSNMNVLKSPNVIGLNGPARKWKAVRYGCALRLLYQGKTRQYMIKPKEENYTKHAWVNKWDRSGLISSYKRGPR